MKKLMKDVLRKAEGVCKDILLSLWALVVLSGVGWLLCQGWFWAITLGLPALLCGVWVIWFMVLFLLSPILSWK